MKKVIKETPKEDSSSDKKNTRPTTKQTGYKEKVYNSEEQNDYQKSDAAKNGKKNTAGPED